MWILVATRRPGSPPVSDEASEPWRVALQAGPGTCTPAGRADEAQRWQPQRAETVLAAPVGRPTRRSRRLGTARVKASLGTLAALGCGSARLAQRGTDRPLPLTKHARPGRCAAAPGRGRSCFAAPRAGLARASRLDAMSGPMRVRRSAPAATARTPRAGTAPPIRETMFGRVAGHARGDDHVTCAIDAIDRGPGIDGDGHHERRIERAGQESGKLEREIHRGPGGAGGSGREPGHGKAAGPKPKTPGADLGVQPPFPLPARQRQRRPASAAATPACARPVEAESVKRRMRPSRS